MKPYIKIIFMRSDGHRTEGKIAGDGLNASMLDAAEDLVYAMDFGHRREVEYLTKKEIASNDRRKVKWLKRTMGG